MASILARLRRSTLLWLRVCSLWNFQACQVLSRVSVHFEIQYDAFVGKYCVDTVYKADNGE